jgi:limonene-1,2-epoxide hydrolase
MTEGARASDVVSTFRERLDRHRLDHGWRELPVDTSFEVHDGLITVWRGDLGLVTAAGIHDPGAV